MIKRAFKNKYMRKSSQSAQHLSKQLFQKQKPQWEKCLCQLDCRIQKEKEEPTPLLENKQFTFWKRLRSLKLSNAYFGLNCLLINRHSSPCFAPFRNQNKNLKTLWFGEKTTELPCRSNTASSRPPAPHPPHTHTRSLSKVHRI